MPVRKQASAQTTSRSNSKSKAEEPEVSSFDDLFEDLKGDGGDAFTFHITKSLLQKKLSKDRSNAGFRYQTDQGQIITIWHSNWANVVEPVPNEPGMYRTLPGVTVAKDGGLIPANSGGSFFDEE
jgi:hypothetical protein